MTDESGVPAAGGVPPEENVDPPPADAGPDDTAAVDATPAEEPVVTEADVADEPVAADAGPDETAVVDSVPPEEPVVTEADVADEPVAADAIVVAGAPGGTAPPSLAQKPAATTGAPERGIPPGDRVGLIEASLFGLFVVAVGVALVYVLIKIWPKVPHGQTGGGGGAATGANNKPVDLFWGLFKFDLLPDTALIGLTAIMGGIGASVFIAVSFSDYVGNRRFAKSWVWFYLVRLFVGPALAIIFYFTLRGGFLATSSSGSDINAYGIAAMAGLVGLFSKQAGDKLHQVFDALFQVDPSHGDAARGDGVTNPAPTISGIEPQLTTTAETLTFTVQGTGFIVSSMVSVGRSVEGEQPTLVKRDTSFASDTELQVTLLIDDVAQPGQLWIAVTNPAPGGGTAGPQPFDIT